LNDHVGRRTEADGYRPAGAVIGPIVYCCDHPANIGGGSSQFTTTLYNAIWWAGLDEVSHTPHTIYFPRYPLVREATLGWPTPDLVFRNSTENAVYLKTEYDDKSITVKVFGDNGGITVEGITSDRRNFTDPEEYFEPDATVNPGEQELRDDGSPGFTADVTGSSPARMGPRRHGSGPGPTTPIRSGSRSTPVNFPWTIRNTTRRRARFRCRTTSAA
jgi:vancomycin resistance protein YoaR